MIDRVDGVLVSAEVAAYIGDALQELVAVAARHGVGVPARLQHLAESLRKVTNASQTQVNASSNASDSWLAPDWGNHEGYGTCTPAQAAEILGCTAANVRDLAERGTIAGTKIGGRWQLDRHTVQALADSRYRA